MMVSVSNAYLIFARSSASVLSDIVSLNTVRKIPATYAIYIAMMMNDAVGPMNVRARMTLAVPMPNIVVWQGGWFLFL